MWREDPGCLPAEKETAAPEVIMAAQTVPPTLALEDAETEIRKRLFARVYLRNFTQYTFPAYELNWHHRLTFRYLDLWVAGVIQNLMIFEPPRHGKSEQVSRRLPAYLMGRFPDDPIITGTHTERLAARMNRSVQRIMASLEYRRLFPGTRLAWKKSDEYQKTSEILEVVGHRGYYLSLGVGQAVTGMGFRWGIIDDTIRNREEANSPAYREKQWEWYASDFNTRAEKQAQRLLTVTRWHSDDLPGRILDKARKDPSADQWTVLTLPAIAEDDKHEGDIRQVGEALWPNKFSRQALDSIRALDEYTWLALYQQRPPVGEGVGGAYFRFGEANIRPCQFNPKLPLIWTLDFNVNPMCTLLCQQHRQETQPQAPAWQISYEAAQRNPDTIEVLDEICILNTDTVEMCDEFERRGEALSGGKPLIVYAYGDASGGSRSTNSKKTDWQIIRERFASHRFIRLQTNVPRSNPGVKDRVNSVNMMLRNLDGLHRLHIDPRCRELRTDLEKVRWKVDMSGNTIPELDKTDPMRTHVSDALGYYVWYEFRPLAAIGEKQQRII